MNIQEKLQKLIQIKADLKAAIKSKGVEVEDDALFEDYPDLINSIIGGISGAVTDKLTMDNHTKDFVINRVTDTIDITTP